MRNRRQGLSWSSTCVRAAMLVAVPFLCASVARATTVGPNNPGSVVSDNSFGTAAWSDTTDAETSDDVYAATSPAGAPTQYLKATNFGFSLPTGAVIIGISASIERSSAAGTVYDASVKIVKGNVVTGTEHAKAPSTLWPDTDAVENYGSSSDLWSTTWTASDINSTGFGVAVSAVDSFDVALVDEITLTVVYSSCGDNVIEGGETCEDGNTVNGDCCSSTCHFDSNVTPCTTDGDICTNDLCDGAGTCTHPNNNAPCDDGDPCTSNDMCSAGSCAGSGFCLDHFKCYQGKDLKNPKFVKQVGELTTDQFANNQPVDVKKLKYVCNAVDVNGAGIENPNAYLACYLLKAPVLSPRPWVEVSTQFQSSRFENKKGKLLCLPSTLTVLP